MTETYFSTTAEAAALYVGAGWQPVPLKPGDKYPTETGWLDREYAAADFQPGANVGVKLGEPSGGLTDADLDDALAAAMARHFLPPTEAVFGRPGKPDSHRLYYAVGDLTRVAYEDPIDGAMLLELRGDGHQTMMPPSTHPSGETVAWSSVGEPGETAAEHLTTAAGWLASATFFARHWDTWKSQRHALTLALAGWLIGAGKSAETVEQFVRAVCIYTNDHEPDKRIVNVRDTALKIAAGETVTGFGSLAEIITPKAAKRLAKWLGTATRDRLKGATTAASYRLHDTGNAERMAEQHGDDLRYCAERKCWYVWNGTHWEADVTGEAYRRAMQTVRRIPDEARDVEDKDERAAILKHAIASESGPRIESMVKLAQKLDTFAIRADDFDRDVWLLNTPSGTVNMRTGGIRPHDRADLITRITGAPYKHGTTSKLWDDFLCSATEGIDVATGEREPTAEERAQAAELRGFLQRLAGMSATGDASEEYAPLIHGPEQSGKSTFVAALVSALGDYAKTTDFDTFLKRQHAGGIRTDLVRLNRAYMVASVEVEDGRELAAALFKRITGGDEQTARGLYTSEITIRPTATYWLVSNHAPRVDATDGAMWRRILRIPFPHTVPKEKRQPGLKKYLTNPALGGPAVLAWIVEGALAWQRDGLRVPDAVTAATAELRRDMDRTSEFLEDRCEFAADATAPVEDLHQSYLDWCRSHGVKVPLDRKRFGRHLSDVHGCTRERGTGGQWRWRGVKLNQARITEIRQANPFERVAAAD